MARKKEPRRLPVPLFLFGPPALEEQDLQEVKALLKGPDITVEQVARRLGVAPSTLYRHLPDGRGATA